MSARNPAAQGGLYGGLPQPNALEPPFARGLQKVSHHALHEEMREANHSLFGPIQLHTHPMIIEQHLEAQKRLIEALQVDKERLIATNASLKRELEDTRKQHAEKDLQISILYKKSGRMENELRAMRFELLNVHKCIKDLTANNAGLKAELKQVRAAIEHEKKSFAECFQHGKAMENKVITMAREMENLRVELANAKNRAHAKAAVGDSECFKVATGSVENLTDARARNNNKKKRRKKPKKKPKIKDEILNIDQIKMDTWSKENLAEGDMNGESERTTWDVKILDVNNAGILSKNDSSKRKLLVLDVNGLLGNVVKPEKRRRCEPKIVKRPFVDDFLEFCLQNFDVGVWSSRAGHNLEGIIVELFGHLKDKLLFCWDQTICKKSRYHTHGNPEKPIFFKILSKIWEIDYSYDESNTLLLDDSPEKALLNPLHTAIFPKSYEYKDENDNSLGLGGDLRVYLEGLLRSENV